MSTIIGIKWDGELHLIGDSAAISGWTREPVRTRKVVRHRRGFLFGAAGDALFGQIAALDFDPPPPEANVDPDDYVAGPFSRSLRTTLAGHGYPERDSDGYPSSHFLLGYDGHLYKGDTTGIIERCLEDFASIGTGREYVLGALEVSEDVDVDAALRAIGIAAKYNIATGPPFEVVSGTGSWLFDPV